MNAKRLLFSLTAKDFEVQTFCTGGPGGQHRNAKRNGVRIIHKESGARAEHRDGRDQAQNKQAAFFKLLETKAFKAWHRVECAKKLGIISRVDATVDEMMAGKNVRLEVFDGKGWIQVDEKDLDKTGPDA